MRRAAGILVALAVLAFLAAVPTLSWDTHGIFSSPLDSPGTLTLLGLCLIFAGVAMSYDLLFGDTGLLSFGHALYFAAGVYVMAIALERWELWQAVLVTIAVGIVLPIVVGSVSLRVSGIAFAMVTLAFAQAGTVLVQKNPNNLTGGEEGLPLAYEKLPSSIVGVVNTKHLYWLALGYLVFVVVVVRWSLASSPGHVWRAIRENEQRVEVIGLRPFGFKLLSFVIAAFLATLGGIVYLLLLGTGASPQVVSASFTLSLLVGMSVLETTHGTTIANLGFETVAFPAPVFCGDTIHAETEVVAARGSGSRPDAGIVTFEHRAFNQDDRLVCSARRNALMQRRPDA